MSKHIRYVVSSLLFVFVSTCGIAEVIDPEKHIVMNGYHSVKMGADGKTRFYSFTERAASPRITALENEISKLPKHVDIQKMCDFMRGGTKAKLIEQRGISIDVAVTNYGYSGSTVACVLKYMHESNVGTQLIYNKKGTGGMYMVFVVDVMPVEASETIDTRRIAKNLNKNFPMMTNPETRIDGAFGLNKELRFKYTLINHVAADLSTQDINELGKFYLNSVCTIKELQLFVKNGITISYAYFGKDGMPITTISVKPYQCGPK